MTLSIIIATLAFAALIGGFGNVVKSTGLTTKGIRSTFFERYSKTPTFYQDLATLQDSDTDKEIYKFLGAAPRVRELGTGVKPAGLRTDGVEVRNKDWEVSVELDRSEVRDDQTGQIKMRVMEAGQFAAMHKDILIANALKNGGDAASLAYDGLPFFSTAHVSGDSGAQSNDLTIDISAVTPAEPDTPNNPSARTLQVGYGLALAALMGFKDDRGEPMDITPSGLVACVNPNHMITWDTALNAAILGSTSNMLEKFRTRVVPMARLTATDTHYLLKTDAAVRPFIDQHREDWRYASLEDGSEMEVKENKHLHVWKASYEMAYGRWAYAIRFKFV